MDSNTLQLVDMFRECSQTQSIAAIQLSQLQMQQQLQLERHQLRSQQQFFQFQMRLSELFQKQQKQLSKHHESLIQFLTRLRKATPKLENKVVDRNEVPENVQSPEIQGTLRKFQNTTKVDDTESGVKDNFEDSGLVCDDADHETLGLTHLFESGNAKNEGKFYNDDKVSDVLENTPELSPILRSGNATGPSSLSRE